MARRGNPRKGSILGKPYPHREILFPGHLDLLQPYLLAGKCAKLAVAVAPARSGGRAYSRWDIGDFQKSITACVSYRLRFRLVGSLARGGQNVERVSARLRRCDSDEPGKDVSICCRHDAVENQIRRDRFGNHFRGPNLHCEPSAAVFGRHSGVKQDRQRCASDRLRFDRYSFSTKRVRRDRRLSLACCVAHVTDVCLGWGLSLRRRCSC